MNSLAKLKIQFAAELTRAEMKNVLGGYMPPEDGDGDGPCRLAYRAQDSGAWIGWSFSTFSVAQAQADYQNGTTLFVDGVRAYVSGYCCASC